MTAEAPIEVMLVEDSAVTRGLIARGLGADAGLRVCGMAGNGQEALNLLQTQSPRVIVLDIEMPVMNGLEALPKILAKRPNTIVIMASALTRRHAAMSLKALELGAADYVPKPDAAEGPGALPKFLDELRAKIRALTSARTALAKPLAEPRMLPVDLQRFRPSAIAIGSSTGGPPALNQICQRIGPGLNVPVFITQHMPPTFTAMLAEQLGKVSGAPAYEGADGMRVKAGAIYVAPGGRHMLVDRRTDGVVIRLSDEAPEHFCRPAVDPMFRSVADVYGAGALAVVLTGMGRDGADGALAIANKGGRFITQDESTSAVYGMPGAAFRTGRASAEFPIDQIAVLLSGVATGRAL